ncbi:bifunctional 3-demethylubiquinone-9 3-methyltransferase/ 2-octaprenyl-6-hydroxy phenol methylase [Tautonia plasticadhaerens]|uniref:Bifunctional 3-demethylubiquinone-9 3-methyltransferase/ 2-octaprenyl-6-hydroxy phenol methylase n=1 Tax=Tautonia plasticadhaerens TaxID=2527974 RepID=A0A518HAH5_9BACT|nr:bifunctional 3-demethylubiquinone-9 3-methyltransferase/ 2-octaprenyl-6-hydroxy phenol methylase [Tautonia plasticadhaerens]
MQALVVESPPTTPPAFDYDQIPLGYYDEVMRTGHPVRRCWHRQKFQRALAALPPGPGLSVLDIGCFAGTFLGMLPGDRFPRQLGVDIIPKQIEWAASHYAAPYREFRAIPGLSALADLGETFDCVTLIEVLEHLSAEEIRALLGHVGRLLKPGGRFLMTTPNYASAWPLLERILNRASDVKYEEQHLSKFTYPGFERQLRAISPGFERDLELELKTTSHLLSPFVGAISEPLAMWLSRCRDPGQWRFPFGSLILARFRKTEG